MKLVILLTLLMVVANIVSAQKSASTCRTVEIDIPHGYLQKNQTYYVSAKVSNYSPDAPKLTFQWKLPEKPEFTVVQNGFGAAFVASEDLDGLDVKVTLITIQEDGACRSEATESFHIYFNPGTPLILDDYGSLPIKEELERLDALAAELREKGYNALIDIRYKRTDTRAAVSNRVQRIVKRLVVTRGIPRDRLGFTYSESESRGVRIYALPKGSKPVNHSIDDLPITGRKGRTGAN